ncbi:hypothetical protein GCM10009765_22100 [Fodinicola feengrottensis]|uniref:Uncharacterized protein n=1 Tax=Fodinicola feengrottensis TaxID=435914 RepID=A0ABN2GJJ0_9ACTN
MPLPARTDDGTAPFLRRLVDVVHTLGIDIDPEQSLAISSAGNCWRVRRWEMRAAKD